MRLTKTQVLVGISACALFVASSPAQGIAHSSSAIPLPVTTIPPPVIVIPMPAIALPMPVIQEPKNPPSQSPDQTVPNQESKIATFTGTVVKDGKQYVLRDSSGSIYKLDDSSRAQAFEGKAVKVTGRLDADSKVIHVDSIQALRS